MLLFTASELEYYALRAQFSPFVAGIFGGMGGGIAQAYATVHLSPECRLMVDGVLYDDEDS